ncbi:MAG: hypothetical protein Kow0090_11500 [Myxococcota bacterium]
MTQGNEKIKSTLQFFSVCLFSFAFIAGCGVGRMGYYKSGGGFHTYRIEQGDTLNNISDKYGVSAEEIITLNKIERPDKIKTGDVIKIPKKNAYVAGSASDISLASSPRIQNAAKSNPANKVVASDSAKTKKPTAGKKFAYKQSAPAPEIVRDKATGQGFQWPIKGVLYAKFGARKGRHHDGIDISAPKGTVIRAAADGKVLFSGEHRGYGNIIIIGHSDDFVTVYAHNDQNLVSTGDKVQRGEKIGLVGETGRATGPHLHFELRKGTKPIDPLKYLP